MRGLKPYSASPTLCCLLVAPYVGAWIETLRAICYGLDSYVAPYVGAWIETNMDGKSTNDISSHPTWVRGLKLLKRFLSTTLLFVAPYVGAWIETRSDE